MAGGCTRDHGVCFCFCRGESCHCRQRDTASPYRIHTAPHMRIPHLTVVTESGPRRRFANASAKLDQNANAKCAIRPSASDSGPWNLLQVKASKMPLGLRGQVDNSNPITPGSGIGVESQLALFLLPPSQTDNRQLDCPTGRASISATAAVRS